MLRTSPWLPHLKGWFLAAKLYLLRTECVCQSCYTKMNVLCSDSETSQTFCSLDAFATSWPKYTYIKLKIGLYKHFELDFPVEDVQSFCLVGSEAVENGSGPWAMQVTDVNTISLCLSGTQPSTRYHLHSANFVLHLSGTAQILGLTFQICRWRELPCRTAHQPLTSFHFH